MQLWLKSIAGVSEYAMNKPPESEMWPNTRPVEFTLWPKKLPEGMDYADPHTDADVTWDLEKLDGAQMRMVVEGSHKQVLDRIAIIWTVVETHRTHCPRCWQKYEGSPYFMGSDMGGHQAFHCPADDDWDDRFPREG